MDAETLTWIVASGAATGIGGLALLMVRAPSPRLLDTLLGFAAGVMLRATAFSLLVPGLDRGGVVDELIPESHGHGFEREATLALAAGFAMLMVLDNTLG